MIVLVYVTAVYVTLLLICGPRRWLVHLAVAITAVAVLV